MPATSASKEDMIRAKAHALWQEEGCPDGRAEHHWLRASALVNAEIEADPAPAAKPTRKTAPRKRA